MLQLTVKNCEHSAAQEIISRLRPFVGQLIFEVIEERRIVSCMNAHHGITSLMCSLLFEDPPRVDSSFSVVLSHGLPSQFGITGENMQEIRECNVSYQNTTRPQHITRMPAPSESKGESPCPRTLPQPLGHDVSSLLARVNGTVVAFVADFLLMVRPHRPHHHPPGMRISVGNRMVLCQHSPRHLPNHSARHRTLR